MGSCLPDNKKLIDNQKLNFDTNAVKKKQFEMTWTPTKDATTISGFLLLDFLTPKNELFRLINFKVDTIQGLANLIIDLSTLTFASGPNRLNTKLMVVKTKEVELTKKEDSYTLKLELQKYCGYEQKIPTFLIQKHKDSNGQFQRHYSNIDTYEQTTSR
jgi:hypothetical protein